MNELLRNAIIVIAIIIGVTIGIVSFVPDFTAEDSPLDCMNDEGICEITNVFTVIDGDTLRVPAGSIRLAMTSTPELNEIGGDEAKLFVQNLCDKGTRIHIDEDDGQLEGSYGRMIAKVYCDNVLLNEAILEAGHGEIDTRFCEKSEFGKEDWAIKFGC